MIRSGAEELKRAVLLFGESNTEIDPGRRIMYLDVNTSGVNANGKKFDTVPDHNFVHVLEIGNEQNLSSSKKYSDFVRKEGHVLAEQSQGSWISRM